MTSFSIVSCGTPDYLEKVAPHFTPSWRARSGAEEIEIVRLDQKPARDALYERLNVIERRVLDYPDMRCVYLDLDCLTVRDLSPAFQGLAIGVARWPDLNAGAIYFDTPRRGAGYWKTLFAKWKQRATELRPHRVIFEQEALQAVLAEDYDADVERLDWREWNCCCGRSGMVRQVAATLDTVRVVHLKVGKDIRDGRPIAHLAEIKGMLNL